MEILQQTILSLTKEEVRTFKLWLHSTNTENQRKDVLLFDYIRKSADKYDEEFIHRKLYGSHGKNSFYKLKHRLQEDLAAHLALQYFGKHPVNTLYWYTSLHQIFLSKNQPALALYYLRKAEKNAAQAENFEMLDMIYASFVKLSADMPDINPEIYIIKQNENSKLLSRIRQADQALAAVNYRLKLTQNFGAKDVGLQKLLDNTIKEFARDESLSKSKSFQTRIYRAVSQSLIQNHNFVELEQFMLVTYNRFVRENWFDKANHETKIQMLIYVVNALFKNKKYSDSLDYAETLGEELSAFNNMLYDKFFFFYYNALVINYAQIDLKRGVKALDELERELKGRKNSYYEFFVYLNKANLLFFQHKTNEAIRNLMRLYVNDHYKKADVSLKLKIAVAECIMQCESGDEASTPKRVEQVKKQFSELLLKSTYSRERAVLRFVPDFLKNLTSVDKDKFKKRIADFIARSVAEGVEDGEVIRYKAWLSNKLLQF